jgi:hypothetical protein
VQTVIASDGTAVDVMFLPPNASARHSTKAKMREYMVNVFEIEPLKYSAIRTAFTECPDRVPELDGWLGDKASTPLEDHLRASTATVLADLLRLHKSFAVVVDDTHPYPAAYALGTKAVAGMVRLVSGMVQNGDLDEPSELMFLAFLRRHDHYASALGDSKPEELELQHGPSLNHPNSSCLYACRRDNPRVRLDVGADKTFAEGLKAFPDQDVQSNAKRRLAAAIREETRPVRDLAKVTHPPFCVRRLQLPAERPSSRPRAKAPASPSCSRKKCFG